jgi:hypothetical protein
MQSWLIALPLLLLRAADRGSLARRLIVLALAVALALAALASPTRAVSDLLPDLGMDAP